MLVCLCMGGFLEVTKKISTSSGVQRLRRSRVSGSRSRFGRGLVEVTLLRRTRAFFLFLGHVDAAHGSQAIGNGYTAHGTRRMKTLCNGDTAHGDAAHWFQRTLGSGGTSCIHLVKKNNADPCPCHNRHTNLQRTDATPERRHAIPERRHAIPERRHAIPERCHAIYQSVHIIRVPQNYTAEESRLPRRPLMLPLMPMPLPLLPRLRSTVPL